MVSTQAISVERHEKRDDARSGRYMYISSQRVRTPRIAAFSSYYKDLGTNLPIRKLGVVLQAKTVFLHAQSIYRGMFY